MGSLLIENGKVGRVHIWPSNSERGVGSLPVGNKRGGRVHFEVLNCG